MKARWIAGVGAGAVAVVVLADADTTRRLAHHNRPAQAAFEAVAAVIALLAAYLVWGRFRQRASHFNLVLAAALAVMAGTNLFFLAVPAMHVADIEGGWQLWRAAVASLAGQVLLVVAVVSSDRVVPNPRRFALAAAMTIAGGFLVLFAVVGLLHHALPDVLRVVSHDGHLTITAHPLIVALEIIATTLYAIAAVGFVHRAQRDDDQLMRWLAAGAGLAAAARLSYVAVPSLYSDYLYVGDVFRMGFYVVLLVGVFVEIRTHWVSAAIAEERRRLARDLHDGLAQELAFIASQTRRLARAANGSPTITRLSSAADRAVNESRRAIAALTRPLDEPFTVTLTQAAEEIADRVGTTLHLDLPDLVVVPQETGAAVIRVVQEAITNAGRHGQASLVRVSLRNGDGVHVEVIDDGDGFDLDRVPTDGSHFGLVSMRERVEALGGELDLRSSPGHGTTVAVDLP